MSFCPKCGKEIGDWDFCNHCGANIKEYLDFISTNNTEAKECDITNQSLESKEPSTEKKKNVEIIEKDYSGGVPVQTSQLPIYYRVSISDEEYAAYKKLIRKQYKDDWLFNKNEFTLRLVTKFDLGCTIKKNEIIFGFSNMDMIHP